MATIPLTGDVGLDANIELAPFSSLLKYFQQLPALRASNGDFSKAAGMTLDQPALTSISTGLSFDKSYSIGAGSAALTVLAGAHGSLELIQRTPSVTNLPDVIASDAAIGEGSCYLGFGVQACVGFAVGPDAGTLQFGIGPNETAEIWNYQSFPLHQGITLLDAVEKTVGDFLIPASADDLASLPDGSIATVTGTGSLKFSGTANLLAVTNPLASLTLPSPLPVLSVTAGGTLQVGASLALQCKFQVCAQKTGPGRVRLGWCRDKTEEFDVTATLAEGVSAGFGTTDLFSALIGVVSSNAAADLNELQKAGLAAGQIKAIQDAVKAAVCRKLELALCTEISAIDSRSAAFQYDVELAALTDTSRLALNQALAGDLSALDGSALAGITPVRSVWETTRTKRIRLEVNLLGILNFGSVSSLALSGAVMVEPATGAIVITDKATAQRIQSTALNFGADTGKLCHVLAESFLLTATYRGMQQQVGQPALTCSHDFFDLQNDTTPGRMKQELRVGAALGLFSAAEAAPPAGTAGFGRTMIHARTDYDSLLASALFLDAAGAPLPQEFYENAGRAAIQLLVSEGDEDAVRLRPAIDDGLWSRMKEQGQPGFAELFPGVPEPFLSAVTADYSAIIWWAEAMAGAGPRLAAIGKWFGQHPTAPLDDPAFESLRQDLAGHLKKVAATTSEEFGQPWGLIAMDQASGRKAVASILITGPKLTLARDRALTARANP